MKFNFKKITAVGVSVLMSSMALVGATYPEPFVQNGVADYAIVYGTGVGVSALDLVGASKINDNLLSLKTTLSDEESLTNVTSDFSSSVSVLDEMGLGEDIRLVSKLKATMIDNQLSTLLDEKISWDNGDGEKSYDIHEEILLGDNLKLVTNLNHGDGEDLDSFVVLQNDESLDYRLVFDDELIYGAVPADADNLEVTILGKDYKISDFNPGFTTITISSAEERVVQKGTILTIDGITLTIGEIFENAVEVNGILIKEDATKKVNGIEVEVDSIATHIDASFSKAIIKFGKDIKRDISSGDEYIKDDETWEWDLGIDEGNHKQYIGVKYTLKNIAFDEDEPEENPLVVGESYIFPENYAALSFDSLTNVTYQDFELSFDDKSLYQGEGSIKETADVAVLEGEEEDSITLINGSEEIETDSIYFRLNETGVEVYFEDIDGDVDSEHEGRIQYSGIYYDFDVGLTIDKINSDVAKLIFKDTEITLGLNLNANETIELTLTNGGEVTNIPLGYEGVSFDKLGLTEESELTDIIVGSENIGNKDFDVMDNYGTIIKDPESNADDNIVILSVPEEQVQATISLKGQGQEVVTSADTAVVTNLGGILVKDTEIASVNNMNLVIVGGSCINSAAARILGSTVPLCGADWTKATNVGAGQFIVKEYPSPFNANKVALLVAGYETVDTTAAVDSLFI